MRVRMLNRRPAEDGFTLIEVLLSVMILGMIVSALVGAMLVTVRGDRDAETRLGESRDEQFTAMYFGDDVQGAQSVAANSPAGCGTDPSAQPVVAFVEHDFTVEASAVTVVQTRVAYVLLDGGATLHRLSCPVSSTTPTGDITVARELSTAVAPVVSCEPSPCASGAAMVKVRLTEQSGDLNYYLVGHRRTA